MREHGPMRIPARRVRRRTSRRAVIHLRRAFGLRLRALRQRRSLTQERLGELAGLSGKFIGEVERGDKSISLDSLYRTAGALHVSLRVLVEFAPGRSRRG